MACSMQCKHTATFGFTAQQSTGMFSGRKYKREMINETTQKELNEKRFRNERNDARLFNAKKESQH